MSDAASDAEQVSPEVTFETFRARTELSDLLDTLKPKLLYILNRKPPDDEEIEQALRREMRQIGRAARRLRDAYQKEWEELPQSKRQYLLSLQKRQKQILEKVRPFLD